MNKGFDIIGDVHSSYDQLLALLNKLGYRHEQGRDPDGSWDYWLYQPYKEYDGPDDAQTIVFSGDALDRGTQPVETIYLIMQLVADKLAVFVRGNHDDKLRRYLKATLNGEKFKGKMSHGLDKTVEALEKEPVEFRQTVLEFLTNAPTMFETDDLIVVHAAYKQTGTDKARTALNLYGETNGQVNEEGYPVRTYGWRDKYSGTKTIVHGHDALADFKPSVYQTPAGGFVVNIDTACAYGGRLTAYRFPGSPLDSESFVSVKGTETPMAELSKVKQMIASAIMSVRPELIADPVKLLADIQEVL